MSAQTIIHSSISSIKKEAEDNLISNANNYLLKEMYALGEGHCEFEVANSCIVIDIIDLNCCAINSMINKEIEKTEEEFSHISTYNNDLSSQNQRGSTLSSPQITLYDLWLSKGNSGTKEEFLTIISESSTIPTFPADPPFPTPVGYQWINEAEDAVFVTTETGPKKLDSDEGEVLDTFGVPTNIDI